MRIGLTEMAANAAAAAGRVVVAFKGGDQIIADGPEHARRLAICRDCPLIKGNTCSACGCFTAAKTKLATESCPKGKW